MVLPEESGARSVSLPGWTFVCNGETPLRGPNEELWVMMAREAVFPTSN